MCTALVQLTPDSAWPLRVTFVRDEDRSRAADPPGYWWPEQPTVAGGRDQRAGGTWLAVDTDAQHTAVAFLLNRHEPGIEPHAQLDHALSRGTLPLLALARGGFHADAVDLARYQPFHLVHATTTGASWWRWDGTTFEHESLGSGLHMIASRGVQLPGEAARRATQLARFGTITLPEPPAEGDTRAAWNGWLDLLDGRDVTIDDLDAMVVTGVSAYPHFGTVGASLVAVARDGRVRYDVTSSQEVAPDAWTQALR
jgi:hypothetical protein